MSRKKWSLFIIYKCRQVKKCHKTFAVGTFQIKIHIVFAGFLLEFSLVCLTWWPWTEFRPSVCLSVTFVSCAKTNKDIFEFFSPSGSQAILVFPYQTGWRYSDRNPPLTGASNARGYETRSSAVAERPRDASCLSVVSFNIPTAQSFYYQLLRLLIY